MLSWYASCSVCSGPAARAPPEVQIFTELPRGDRSPQAAICCGNNPHVDTERYRASDPLERSFLSARRIFAGALRQIANLVEEQSPPVRQLKRPGLRAVAPVNAPFS